MRLLSASAIISIGSALILGLAGFSQVGPGKKVSEADAKFFESRVRPLLFDRCFSCHADSKQMGGLRLDSPQAVAKGGGRGPALVPGDVEKSRLLHVIQYDGDLKMPPAGKLSADEIGVLTEWVRRGAPWPETPPIKNGPVTPDMRFSPTQRKFWSFQPVRRPGVPTIREPEYKVRNPIDAFLLAELRKKGLPPAPPADKRALIRRATFDLTGLPPTPGEVRDFLSDSSPNAYEKVVDRLLASPRYGERWGRHWLDLVRYCDSLDARSLGAPGDIGEAWRYRDWVVNAFNSDLPYDEFVKDQIAGDLRPARNPGEFNRDGLIATTMLAIGNWGNGDADKEKIQTDIVDDQVDVISRGFMGLTIACARCHDHKFDPIGTKDYYGLAGFFFSTHILAKFTPKGAGEDIMRTAIAPPSELEARKKHAARLIELEAKLKASEDQRRKVVAEAMRADAGKYLLAAWDYNSRPTEQAGLTLSDFARQRGLKEFAVRQWQDFAGMGGYRVMSASARDVHGSPGVFAWKGVTDTPSATINTTTDARTLLTFTLPPRSVCVHPGPRSGVAVAWKSPITGTVRIDGGLKDADPACGDGVSWRLQVANPAGARDLVAGGIENGAAQTFRMVQEAALNAVEVRAGDTVQLLVLPKNGYECDTTAVALTVQEVGSSKTWDLAADLMEDPLSGNPHKDRLGNPAVWSLLDMATGGSQIPKGPLAAALEEWRRKAGKADSLPAERESAANGVAAAFDLVDGQSPFWPVNPADLADFPDPKREETAGMAHELESLRKQSFPALEYANAAQDGGIPETPYAGFHDARVHVRGSYARQTDVVPRRFPTILAGDRIPRIAKGSGRVELAEWIASASHPLTARVMVNRIWQHHFGEGIVRTPSNFGFLGERPTNPALVDWLASEFVRGGWSVKRLHRLIMASAAYRQSSASTPLAMRLDPDNRLFGRQNRKRLEAEAIRDSLLAVAGKLDEKRGGPAVRDLNTPRRTLYVITIRSDRTGFGPLFDAADTTAPIDRRTVSIVAPQSLFMLNNSFALQQAKSLAGRLVGETEGTEVARIETAYELLFGRPPSSREVAVGKRVLAASRLGRTAQVAGTVVPDIELQAWEAYCQVLLCSNEFLFVD
jgi:hypothetical protein